MTLHEELRSIFGRTGWLVARGGHHLPEQLAYALSIADWLEGASSKPLALIEGDTGTGKTLGYLFPLVLHWQRTGEKSVVATHTVALQKQLMEGDLKTVDDYLMSKEVALPRFAQRLGMRHFVDPYRVARFVETDPQSNDLIAFHEWAEYSASNGIGLIDEWLELYGDLPEGISTESVCLTQGSPDNSNLAYELHKSQSKSADILLTSHMMVLLEARSGRQIIDLERDHFSHVLFDEADQLPSSAESLSNRRTQPRHIIMELENLIGAGSSSLDHKLGQSIGTIRQIDSEFQLLGQNTGAEEIVTDQDSFHSTSAKVLLNLLQQECKQIDGFIQRSELGRKNINEQAHHVHHLLEWVYQFGGDPKASEFGVHAIAWSPVKKIPSLMYQKANPAFFISNLWRKLGLRACFTSATLGAASTESEAGAFVPYKASLAIAGDLICVEAQYAPKSFGSMSIVLADGQTAFPLIDSGHDEDGPGFNPGWISYVTSMISQASAAGPTLVLTGSYTEASHLGKKLKSLNPLIHKKGYSLKEVITSFQRGGSQILITPAAWQGVSIRDVNGDQLITELVITRIPFLPPNPTRERLAVALAKRSGMKSPGLAKNYEILARRNIALVKLRQGIGRLIRNKNDSGTLWIADPRFPLPSSSNKNGFFKRAIPARFSLNYDQANIFTLDGHTRRAKKLVPAHLQEFVNL